MSWLLILNSILGGGLLILGQINEDIPTCITGATVFLAACILSLKRE
jgi:hypothetical protein